MIMEKQILDLETISGKETSAMHVFDLFSFWTCKFNTFMLSEVWNSEGNVRPL